jgi:pimeloyl-ACP methyl ester carboxylesterase
MTDDLGAGREYMVRVGRLSFHVVEWGDARNAPVLLLHGRSANAISWERLAARLADRYRVVAFDQRGHRLSDWPGRYTHRLLISDVVAGVAQVLGLDRFALVGHSMGAAIAWGYAARHSDNLRCLVLMDSTPDPPGYEEPYPRGLKLHPDSPRPGRSSRGPPAGDGRKVSAARICTDG